VANGLPPLPRLSFDAAVAAKSFLSVAALPRLYLDAAIAAKFKIESLARKLRFERTRTCQN